MICLDLDGVLADFVGGANIVHGKVGFEPTHWNYFEDWGITADEFWEKIDYVGHDVLYRDIVEPYPWCRDLVARVASIDNFIIVTAPTPDPLSYAGKKIWVDKHLPGAKLAVMSHKQLLSKPGTLLIDDNDRNVIDFVSVDNPGDAFRFPQPWNGASEYVSDRMGYVQDALVGWSELIGI